MICSFNQVKNKSFVSTLRKLLNLSIWSFGCKRKLIITKKETKKSRKTNTFPPQLKIHTSIPNSHKVSLEKPNHNLVKYPQSVKKIENKTFNQKTKFKDQETKIKDQKP